MFLSVQNGHYDAVFSCEVETSLLPSSQAIVEIKHLPVTPEGDVFDPPQHLRKAERKLKRLQRVVSRKKQGSRRRKKAVRQVAKTHEHVANPRRDTSHKIARQLVNACDLIALEDLNTQGLLKNHHLAKSIADARLRGPVAVWSWSIPAIRAKIVRCQGVPTTSPI